MRIMQAGSPRAPLMPSQTEAGAVATAVAAFARMPAHEVARFLTATTRSTIEITSLEARSPLAHRRRPAWEAFVALVGQGFFGGGSRNG